MWRFALRARAGTGTGPGAVARGHTGAQVVVLEADACGGRAELVTGRGLPS